jgi:hypothetical protein
VFILLLLSGERNFGVRLNKPYTSRIPIDIPVFSGTHADLLIIVFHKLISSTNQRLHLLYDCLLTIIVNISPYIKTLCMVASTKLLHLLEAFSSSSFLFANNNNYNLIFFLLEILNNMIQYQFDGNYNLVYTIIRKRNIFFNLSNLQADESSIETALKTTQSSHSNVGNTSQSSHLNGGIKASLLETPSIIGMTEKTNPSPLLNTTQSEPAFTTDDPDYTSTSNNNDSTLSNPLSDNQTSSSSHSDITNFDKSYLTSNMNQETATATTKISRSQSSPLTNEWIPSSEWISTWKSKLPLQTIMRLLQVLVPQVEKICLDKGLTDETEILKFLQNGTLGN